MVTVCYRACKEICSRRETLCTTDTLCLLLRARERGINASTNAKWIIEVALLNYLFRLYYKRDDKF